jgi:hypothetical protein
MTRITRVLHDGSRTLDCSRDAAGRSWHRRAERALGASFARAALNVAGALPTPWSSPCSSSLDPNAHGRGQAPTVEVTSTNDVPAAKGRDEAADGPRPCAV